MAGLYIDSSALGRVLLAEPDAQVIRDTIARYDTHWSSALITVELRRLGRRTGLQEDADKLLARISTNKVDSHVLRRAADLDPVEVRTLDAIHLDAAIRLRSQGEIEAMLTFDEQLQDACVHHGLSVEAPVAS